MKKVGITPTYVAKFTVQPASTWVVPAQMCKIACDQNHKLTEVKRHKNGKQKSQKEKKGIITLALTNRKET